MKLPAFDIVGDIAIVEIPEDVDEKKIARKIKKVHKRIKTVLKKASNRYGAFRLRKLKLIGGINKSVTIHKEFGCLYKLNVRKVYFSPREGTERSRIVDKINKYGLYGLTLVFFAGIGPYAIMIGKKCNVKKVVGIEINPIAVKYFKENIKLNKLDNVEAILGDVAKESKKFYGKASYVVMPLPESGYKYLPQTIHSLKKGGICFFYGISDENDLFDKWVVKIKKVAKNLGRRIKILDKRKVLPYGVRKWKVRIEFKVF